MSDLVKNHNILLCHLITFPGDHTDNDVLLSQTDLLVRDYRISLLLLLCVKPLKPFTLTTA